MTTKDPGDRRRLAQPPSARYVPRSPIGGPDGGADPVEGSALAGPLLGAVVAAMLGAAGLVVVGAILASTFGLLFVAGAMGAAVGLVLARASVPAEGGGPPVARTTVVRYAVVLALVTVVVAGVGLWLFALGEGGTLGPLDYLWTTFGPFVPGVMVVAVVAAAWGASAGPVQR
jgi:hypothetical protein